MEKLEQKTISTLVEMGLSPEQVNNTFSANDFYQMLSKEAGIDNGVLDVVIGFIQEHGDPGQFHELAHTGYLAADTRNIIDVIKSDEKSADFFGLATTADDNHNIAIQCSILASEADNIGILRDTKNQEKAAVYVGLVHDLCLMLTKDAVIRFLGSEDVADENKSGPKRFTKDHHGRSKEIFAKVMKQYIGTSISEEVYNLTLEILDLSNTKLDKEQCEKLQRFKNLYQTIPMIVDGIKHTKINYLRASAETNFASDNLENYLLGYSKQAETTQIAQTAEETGTYGQILKSILDKNGKVEFNHEKMAERLAKKKNFPFLDQVRDEFPEVYNAIVEAATNDEFEKSINSPWYRAGIEGGLSVVEKGLADPVIRKDPEMVSALVALRDNIVKYSPVQVK